MKASIEVVTYFAFVDKICKMTMVDSATTVITFSYMQVIVNPKKPIYIFDDDDVFCYLELNQTEFNILHVELEKDDKKNQGCEQ